MADEWRRHEYRSRLLRIVIVWNAVGARILPRFVPFFTVWALRDFRIARVTVAISLLRCHVIVTMLTARNPLLAMLAVFARGAVIATKIIVTIRRYFVFVLPFVTVPTLQVTCPIGTSFSAVIVAVNGYGIARIGPAFPPASLATRPRNAIAAVRTIP